MMLQIEEVAVGARARPSQQRRLSTAHKTFPRWLRMSSRIAILVGAVALPSLIVKDESFQGLNKFRCAYGWQGTHAPPPATQLHQPA